jgi:peptidoglycan/LPS O-acetylase OafA/YrhL
MATRPAPPARCYSLDVIRGLASLGIVFWHWGNFFEIGAGDPAAVAPAARPLVLLFAPLYQAGFLSVDLFFALSGFVFFSLYDERIARSLLSARQFFVLRFSRLAPLHYATLVFVLAGQALYLHETNHYFHYQVNDATHVILNLLFASAWSFTGDHHSLNGPFWSVSIESLLYVIFFVFCRLLPVRLTSVIAMSLLGLGCFFVNTELAHGIVMFYLGGAVCLLYRRTDFPTSPKILLATVAALWLIPLVLARVPAIESSHRFVIGAAIYMRMIVFPATIYALVVYETQRGTLGKRLALIGDISYSTYLWHFPLQLVCAIVGVLLGVNGALFSSPFALIGFFAVLILTAYLSHRLLEVPAQQILRDKWLPGARRASMSHREQATGTSTH